jgi:hypothetical protein
MADPIRPVSGTDVSQISTLDPKQPWYGTIDREKEIRNKKELERYLDTKASHSADDIHPNNKIDTISSAEEDPESSTAKDVAKQKESKPSSVANLGKWIWEQICGLFSSKKSDDVQENSETQKVGGVDGAGAVGNKPKLEQPATQIDRDKLNKLLKEMKELLTQIKASVEETENNLLEDQHKTESLIYLMILKTVKMQQKLKEEEVGLSKEAVLMHHESMVEIREKYFNLQKDIVERAKTSKVLGWTTTVLTAGIFCVVTAGLALSAVASFGATAPAAAIMAAKTGFFLVGAGLSIASGSVGISKAVLMKKDGEQKATSTLLQNDRKNHKDGTKVGMDEITDDFNKFLQLVGMLRQILDNDQKAKSAQNV